MSLGSYALLQEERGRAECPYDHSRDAVIKKRERGPRCNPPFKFGRPKGNSSGLWPIPNGAGRNGPLRRDHVSVDLPAWDHVSSAIKSLMEKCPGGPLGSQGGSQLQTGESWRRFLPAILNLAAGMCFFRALNSCESPQQRSDIPASVESLPL